MPSVFVFLGGLVSVRARTHSVHALEHMPVFETVVLTMLSNTLEDKAPRQPALHCHSVFSVLPFSIQQARLPPARWLHIIHAVRV